VICSKCKENKPESDFTIDKRRASGKGSWCKTCFVQYRKEYHIEHSKELNAKSSQWAKNNPDKVRKNGLKYRSSHREEEKNRALKYKYSLSSEDYENILEKQNGVCVVCGREETAVDRNGNIKKLQVDHDHITGEIRGLLCSTCNRGIGYLQDDIYIVEKALQYLKEYK
jgi:hypothetical protein